MKFFNVRIVFLPMLIPLFASQHQQEGKNSFGIVMASTIIKGRVTKVNRDFSQSAANGVNVKCFDEDAVDVDDKMASGTTDQNGSFSLSYKKKDSWGVGWDYGWHPAKHPDIYCELSGSGLFPLRTAEKENQRPSKVADYGELKMYTDRSKDCDADGTALGFCGPDNEITGSILQIGVASITGIGSYYLDKLSPACHNHDCCYEADNGETQKQCDEEFYDLMLSLCRDDQRTIGACYAVAYSFYKAVREFGQNFYEGKTRGIQMTSRSANILPRSKTSVDDEREEVFPEDDGYSYAVVHETAIVNLLGILGLFVVMKVGFYIYSRNLGRTKNKLE